MNVTASDYAARIPVCCTYRTLQSHCDGLMLCWGLMLAVEEGRSMDCTGCDLAMPGFPVIDTWLSHDRI